MIYDPPKPIDASPARLKANPKKSSYIQAWLGDFDSEGISGQADEITKKLATIGYDSFPSLLEMGSEGAHAQLEALGILAIHAKMIIRDARALHYQALAPIPIQSPAVHADPKEKSWPTWTERMITTSHQCSYNELLRWLTALLCFVEAHSIIFGPIVRAFCKSPDMGDTDYKDLHDQASGWHLSQLAAAIFSSIPSTMGQIIVSQFPDSFASDGLDILRAVCRPHYGPTALKLKLQQATELCSTCIPKVIQRNQLQLALYHHLQGLGLLAKHGQSPSDIMKLAALNTLIKPLQMADEIKAAENICECRGDLWTYELQLAIVERRAAEWVMLPSHKETAAVSTHRQKHQPNLCNNWLGDGKCHNHTQKNCMWSHDPMFKGRSDLLPPCPNLAQTGTCTKYKCHYRHNLDATTPTLPAQALVAADTPEQQPSQTSEVAELRTMLLSLMKDGAEQKALITAVTAMLTADNTEGE